MTVNSADTERPTHAVVAVIREGSKFLAIRRAEGIRAAGKVCFPGGGIEPGESEEAALVREMQEELGIVVKPQKKVWSSVTSWGVHVNWISAEMFPGKIVIEAAEVQWARWMELNELWAHPDLLESNRQFFEALNDGVFELPGDKG